VKFTFFELVDLTRLFSILTRFATVRLLLAGSAASLSSSLLAGLLEVSVLLEFAQQAALLNLQIEALQRRVD
jgi:hypothetical protein